MGFLSSNLSTKSPPKREIPTKMFCIPQNSHHIVLIIPPKHEKTSGKKEENSESFVKRQKPQKKNSKLRNGEKELTILEKTTW